MAIPLVMVVPLLVSSEHQRWVKENLWTNYELCIFWAFFSHYQCSAIGGGSGSSGLGDREFTWRVSWAKKFCNLHIRIFTSSLPAENGKKSNQMRSGFWWKYQRQQHHLLSCKSRAQAQNTWGLMMVVSRQLDNEPPYFRMFGTKYWG